MNNNHDTYLCRQPKELGQIMAYIGSDKSALRKADFNLLVFQLPEKGYDVYSIYVNNTDDTIAAINVSRIKQ